MKPTDLTVRVDAEMPPHTILIQVLVDDETHQTYVSVNPEPEPEALATLRRDIAEAVAGALDGGGE